MLARGAGSNYDAYQTRATVSIKPEKAEFHAVSQIDFYIQSESACGWHSKAVAPIRSHSMG